MIKRFTVFVIFVALITAGLFFQQILDLLHGMTVLEMLRRSVEFVLHIIVVSILGYAFYTVNELVHPWIKTFQQKERRRRKQVRGRRIQTQQEITAAPRGNQRDKSLLWLISRIAQDYQAQQKRNRF